MHDVAGRDVGQAVDRLHDEVALRGRGRALLGTGIMFAVAGVGLAEVPPFSVEAIVPRLKKIVSVGNCTILRGEPMRGTPGLPQ